MVCYSLIFLIFLIVYLDLRLVRVLPSPQDDDDQDDDFSRPEVMVLAFAHARCLGPRPRLKRPWLHVVARRRPRLCARQASAFMHGDMFS